MATSIVGNRMRARAVLLRRHFVVGWRLLGGYARKWFFYTVYALAIEIGFIAWLVGIVIVAAFAAVVHPWLGGLVGLVALLFSPVVLSMLRSGRRGEPPAG